jgi:hypothetical protein
MSSTGVLGPFWLGVELLAWCEQVAQACVCHSIVQASVASTSSASAPVQRISAHHKWPTGCACFAQMVPRCG